MNDYNDGRTPLTQEKFYEEIGMLYDEIRK